MISRSCVHNRPTYTHNAYPTSPSTNSPPCPFHVASISLTHATSLHTSHLPPLPLPLPSPSTNPAPHSTPTYFRLPPPHKRARLQPRTWALRLHRTIRTLTLARRPGTCSIKLLCRIFCARDFCTGQRHSAHDTPHMTLSFGIGYDGCLYW